MKRLLQSLVVVMMLSACAAPGQPMVAPVPSAAPFPLAEPATLSTRCPSTDSPAKAAVAPTPEATATRLPDAQPTGASGTVQPLPQLGRLAFVRDGSVWAMDLLDTEPWRLAPADKDATLRWSASGQWLAYRYAGGLWVVRRDGRDAHNVADCPLTYAGQPWSPSADELACVGGTWLDVVPVDARSVSGAGPERRRLVTMESSGPRSGISSVAWSPDGKALAYERVDAFGQADGRSGSRASIWRVQADGSGARELVNGGSPSPDRLIVAGWSPGASHVLYRVNEQFSGSFLADGTTLWSVPAEGGTPVQVGGSLASDTRPSKEKALYYADFLAWPHAPSEAAGQLAVTFGGYRGSWTNKRVGVVDVQTGRATLLSPAGMAATSASWSPDTRSLAYSAMPDTGDLVGGDTARSGLMQRRIYVVNAQGDPQPRQLTNDPAYRDELPLWSADGKQILFARLDEQARASLWLVPAEGGAPKQVLDGLALDPLSTWFGYYGHIDWQHVFDWWPSAPALPSQPVARRTYTSHVFMVSFDYPADWTPVQGYEEKYGGQSGFFQVMAGQTGDLTLAEACDREAHHHLLPYGSQPAIVQQQIQGQPACLILPSSDQPAEMAGQAALEMSYPQPVTVNGTRYNHFILYADKNHIEQLARSLRFSSPTENASATPEAYDALGELPLSKGTTWVYSYVAYQPTATRPNQIITATYRLTDTVVGTEAVAPYFVAHVQREVQRLDAPPDWSDSGSPGSGEFWYLVAGHLVYESSQKLDLTGIQTETLTLAFDLPLVIGKSWCPISVLKGQKVQNCHAAGERTVASQESYEAPAGTFSDCYRITEAYNSGGVTRWFCKGAGIVAAKYDHGGTRFGFQQTLVDYTTGSSRQP